MKKARKGEGPGAESGEGFKRKAGEAEDGQKRG